MRCPGNVETRGHFGLKHACAGTCAAQPAGTFVELNETGSWTHDVQAASFTSAAVVTARAGNRLR